MPHARQYQPRKFHRRAIVDVHLVQSLALPDVLEHRTHHHPSVVDQDVYASPAVSHVFDQLDALRLVRHV